MAHNLATVNGKVAMVYQGSTPWHNLGTRLSSITSVAQALEAANLANWDLQLQPMYVKDGADLKLVEDAQQVVRMLDKELISTVGNGYTILSNEIGFGVLDTVCEKYGVTIEAAGALGKGERVWMLAKMPESVEPVPGDKVNGYFLVVLGHDGKTAYFGKLTPIRVVCQNTLDAATSEGENMFRFRHTASIEDRAKVAAELIERMTASLVESGENYAALAARQMSKEEIAEFVANLFPADEDSNKLIERQKRVIDCIYNGKGAREFGNVDGTSASAWAVYNGVVEYIDHVRPAEAKKASAKKSANLSALFGNNAKVKDAAMQAARALVAA
jgi:phage/plasmid-like protein (TIGR03299 family)